jgi:2-keto-4-pentenoate hydratase/2-oxohepta-3-ene-1,7-dioic acid hydratase in catechol pathway
VPLSPSKIVCIGKNYRAHAAEMGGDVPAAPLIFLKPPSAIIGNGDPIVLPRSSSRIEFEGEIALVIGRTLRRATVAEARSAIGSVVAANDVTARDLQTLDGQWTRAKGFDTFCPVGEPGSIPGDLDSMELITRVNGVEKQRARASDMVFSIPEILAYVSAVMTLNAGDLVLTGTPAGVGPLAAGDVVEVEIVGVSSVKNPVEASSG